MSAVAMVSLFCWVPRRRWAAPAWLAVRRHRFVTVVQPLIRMKVDGRTDVLEAVNVVLVPWQRLCRCFTDASLPPLAWLVEG